MQLKIEYIPTSQIKQIVRSIEEFGFRDPIGIYHGEIVEGHGRYFAALELGMDTVPVIRLDDMTDEQRKAYALVHNKLTMNSDFNLDLLEIELGDITDIDMGEFGFELDTEPEEVTEDEYEEPEKVEPRAKRGDLWQLGNHRLMCGDSANAEDVKTLMGGVYADMVFTDPPYGVAIGTKNAVLNSVQPSGRCTENIENDTLGEEELYGLLKAAFVNVRENCKDDACYYVTSPQGGSLGLMMMMMMMRDAGLEVRHVLMWRKNSPTFSLGRLDYDYQHEPIFYTWTKTHHNYRKGKYRSTVWDFDKPRKCDLHPTMKPVELVANAIEDGSEPGMVILDAFGGSGTTIIAAEQTGRSAYLMELDPHYVDVIIDRWEKLTGQKAVLLNG